jgi:N-acetylmuramoyl-L-alanine amidase
VSGTRRRSRPRRLPVVALVAFVAFVATSACSTATGHDPAFEARAAAARPDPNTVADGVLVTPTGVVAPILATFDGGHWVRTPCHDLAPVAGGRVVTRADIVLDPGHGGPETGAVGPTGLDEKVPNLAVTERVATRLRDAGVDVVLTHELDSYYLSLHTRGEIATALHPVGLVAIHHNSGATDSSPQPGTNAFHQLASADGQRLAQLLFADVQAAYARYPVAWVDAEGGVKTRAGDHGDYYGILRYSAPVPAAIIEGVYISDPPEEALLRRADVLEAEGDAIARAILSWLREPRTDAQLTPPAPPRPPGEPSEDAVGCVDPPLD